MRRGQGEDGYILAAALAALLAMSVVAAALVAASLNEARRARAAEQAAVADAALDGAIVLAAAQLVEEPRSRALAFQGPEPLVVAGRSITIQAGWESDKLDVNLASPELVDTVLESSGAGMDERAAVRRRLEAIRAAGGPVRLVDDLVPGGLVSECVRSILTTFGGRPDWTSEDARETIAIGVPAPGSRVWISAWTNDAAGDRAREAVLLVTGDPAAPVRVMDMRSVRERSEEGCHGT